MKIEIRARQGAIEAPFYMVVVNNCIEYGSYSYESVARYYNTLVNDEDAIPLF